MCPVISKDLRKYYKLNKEFSARIIVYRFVLNFYTLCPPSCPDQMIILFIWWLRRGPKTSFSTFKHIFESMHYSGTVWVMARSSTCCSTRSRLSSRAWPRPGFLMTRPSWPTSSLTRKSTQSSSPAPARQILRMEPVSTTWWLCPRGENYLHFMFLLNLKNFFQVWFFFMCQSVRQGAVNPTSYNAMNDNSGLTPDHLYKLTYMLCQLYYNDRAQYAHKRAFLVGKGFH